MAVPVRTPFSFTQVCYQLKSRKSEKKFLLKLPAEISIQILLFGLGIGDGHGVESGSLFVKRVGFDDLLGLEVLEESKHEFAGA